MAVINQPERKLAKRTSVQWSTESIKERLESGVLLDSPADLGQFELQFPVHSYFSAASLHSGFKKTQY